MSPKSVSGSLSTWLVIVVWGSSLFSPRASKIAEWSRTSDVYKTSVQNKCAKQKQVTSKNTEWSRTQNQSGRIDRKKVTEMTIQTPFQWEHGDSQQICSESHGLH